MLYKKIPVSVTAHFEKDGMIFPLIFQYEGKEYKIENISDIEDATTFKSGGTGTRYTVKIPNGKIYLWRKSSIWYLEKRID